MSETVEDLQCVAEITKQNNNKKTNRKIVNNSIDAGLPQ